MFFLVTFYNILNLFAMMLMMKSLSPLPLTCSAVMVLFANIAYHEVCGAVMGISETIACVTRCIVPPRPLSHV